MLEKVSYFIWLLIWEAYVHDAIGIISSWGLDLKHTVYGS